LVCLVLPAVAFAQGPSAGNYYCSDCLVAGPVMDSTTRDFVSIVVNVHVDSWQTSNGTRKSVVICNSTICTTYQYQANGTFISVLEEDNNDQYEYDDEGSTTGSNAGHGGG